MVRLIAAAAIALATLSATLSAAEDGTQSNRPADTGNTTPPPGEPAADSKLWIAIEEAAQEIQEILLLVKDLKNNPPPPPSEPLNKPQTDSGREPESAKPEGSPASS
ncbi:hypothetical protein HIM_08971 [Hirsutella minnesotensis 3608]|uniref:Uncharacterized protein n=1 Tax=Hirsutella minnesotensis 3608 TaxID=1043627 RepID=A0A0F8A3D9_9HYPO|nr:hypothetical protein HIM_08971 [Hirsutella minnesotensis 3608]